jgi:hypothetical protein
MDAFRAKRAGALLTGAGALALAVDSDTLRYCRQARSLLLTPSLLPKVSHCDTMMCWTL